MRLLWLADVLRGAGLDVVEMPGWKDRGRPLKTVHGVVWHHTVTGPSVPDGRVAALLRDGHSTLRGPLSQLGLRRDGTYDLIAAGRCNHNGYGQWGNDSVGIEAYNDGQGEPWAAAQVDAYDRGTAAILAELGKAATAVMGHKETDPRRKIDPFGLDMDAARARISTLLAVSDPVTRPNEGDDMHWFRITDGKGEIFYVSGRQFWLLSGPEWQADVTFHGADAKPVTTKQFLTYVDQRRLTDARKG